MAAPELIFVLVALILAILRFFIPDGRLTAGALIAILLAVVLGHGAFKL
jgi:hypothetical protein